MIVQMDRIQTRDYIYDKYNQGKRICVNRYSDGEYNILIGQNSDINNPLKTGNEDSRIIRNRLLKSIKFKNQLVCINEIKKKNLNPRRKRDHHWVFVHDGLIKFSQHKFYGSANWNIYDFQNEQKLLCKIFKNNNNLIVSGYSLEFNKIYKSNSNMDIDFINVPLKNLSKSYDLVLKSIKSKLKNNYDNIILCCGPSAKCLSVDLHEECESNLIDMGSLINAIIHVYSDDDYIKKWRMSWAKNADLKTLANNLFERIRN